MKKNVEFCLILKMNIKNECLLDFDYWWSNLKKLDIEL